MSNPMGRPQISISAKDLLFRKLEPYLNAGFSLRKACREAKANRAWVYTLIQRDDTFADQITSARAFLSIYFARFIYKLVSEYCYVILSGEQLNPEELDFLKWYAVHANIMSEQFGRNVSAISLIDPEIEIRRFMQIMASNRNTSS